MTTTTGPLRTLLLKKTKWRWREVENDAFENLKPEILSILPFKYYDLSGTATLTTDASTKGLGATLWQTETVEEKRGKNSKTTENIKIFGCLPF